jgi:hypothetical protein
MAEVRFAAEAEACPGCGLHGLGAIEVVGAGNAWSMAFDCPRCRLRRSWQFATRGSPVGVAHDRLELGPGASELLSPAAFLAEIDRVTPSIADDPTKLAAREWRIAAAGSDRVRIALGELRKLVAAGATGADPRLSLPWLDAELDRQRATGARYDADAPRVWALEAGTRQEPLSDEPPSEKRGEHHAPPARTESARADDDPVERDEHARELAHHEHTRGIRPSKLVE